MLSDAASFLQPSGQIPSIPNRERQVGGRFENAENSNLARKDGNRNLPWSRDDKINVVEAGLAIPAVPISLLPGATPDNTGIADAITSVPANYAWGALVPFKVWGHFSDKRAASREMQANAEARRNWESKQPEPGPIQSHSRHDTEAIENGAPSKQDAIGAIKYRLASIEGQKLKKGWVRRLFGWVVDGIVNPFRSTLGLSSIFSIGWKATVGALIGVPALIMGAVILPLGSFLCLVSGALKCRQAKMTLKRTGQALDRLRQAHEKARQDLLAQYQANVLTVSGEDNRKEAAEKFEIASKLLESIYRRQKTILEERVAAAKNDISTGKKYMWGGGMASGGLVLAAFFPPLMIPALCVLSVYYAYLGIKGLSEILGARKAARKDIAVREAASPEAVDKRLRELDVKAAEKFPEIQGSDNRRGSVIRIESAEEVSENDLSRHNAQMYRQMRATWRESEKQKIENELVRNPYYADRQDVDTLSKNIDRPIFKPVMNFLVSMVGKSFFDALMKVTKEGNPGEKVLAANALTTACTAALLDKKHVMEANQAVSVMPVRKRIA